MAMEELSSGCEDVEMIERSHGKELRSIEQHCEDEPYEGMEFESEEATKAFYDAYASRVGFIMRVDAFRRSMRDGAVVWRRLVCNKEGFRRVKPKQSETRRSRAITREGCKAMIVVKKEKSGKWVVTRFVKEHSHPKTSSSRRNILLLRVTDKSTYFSLRKLVKFKEREREMGKSTLFRSPKKEEQEVPDNTGERIEILDELEGFLGINTGTTNHFDEDDDDDDSQNDDKPEGQMLMNFYEGLDLNNSIWEEELLFPSPQQNYTTPTINQVKTEQVDNSSCFGFWDESSTVIVEETKASLNLNLNYEEVLQAWSNRGSFWAVHSPSSTSLSNSNYFGEVPNLEEERTRRESSVLRYKEKRQNRLFSKKIRYQVRKLNADKRPRLKGRFIKRNTPDIKMSKGV